MISPYLAHHLSQLQHLRSILLALGDAEQVPDDTHALFLER
ncbi:MAG TPA: PA2817 family protein, partial [Pseudomonas sp.]|nr:PA2817 family protein [Pseudomonas sp.]